jgi:hypothetical protein
VSRTVILLFAASLAACGAHPPRAEETAVLLQRAPRRADVVRAGAAFDTWVSVNSRIHGSIFRLLEVGPSRSALHERLTVTVPAAWGANAVASRTAFAAQARELFAAAIGGREPRSLGTPAATPPAATSITVLPDLDSRGKRWTWTNSRRMSHARVLCDFSASTAGVACTPEAVLRKFDAWLPGATAPGSSFRVVLVGTSIDAPTIFDLDVPELRLADRIGYLLGARSELTDTLRQPHCCAGSDVVGAIASAVSELGDRQGAKTLVILSDMRESAGPWSFDRHVPESAPAFVSWLRSEHLLQDCGGAIRVTVCGLHFGTTPGEEHSFRASDDSELRTLWMQVFSAMHVQSIAMCGACDADTFADPNGGQ